MRLRESSGRATNMARGSCNTALGFPKSSRGSGRMIKNPDGGQHSSEMVPSEWINGNKVKSSKEVKLYMSARAKLQRDQLLRQNDRIKVCVIFMIFC